MPSQPSPCASSNTASRQEIILFSFVQGAGLTPCAKYVPVSLLLSPGESGYRKLPLECSHFEEALTLRGREPLNYDRMRNLRSHPPRESPEQTAAKPSLRPDTITLQASEFLRFRCEISVWRKNCPSRLEGISKRVSRRVIGDVPICSART